MSDPHALEPALQRFLDNRDSLSDAEFAQLLESLRTQPALAELLKDHLLMDELLAQQFQMDRKDFVGKFEARLREENGHARAASHSDSASQTYALRWPDTAETNGGPNRSPTNGSSGQGRTAATSPNANPPEAAGAGTSNVLGSAAPVGRTGIAVILGLTFVAGGFLSLEYTDAARRIGKLEEVEGMAFIYREEVGTVAVKGMAILPGDEIRVQDQAKVSLTFRDRSRMTLAANSRAVFLPGRGHWPGIFAHELAKVVSVTEGKLDALIEPQPAGRPLRLHTPQFQAKVQGTRVIATVHEDQSQLEVLEGSVQVESLRQGDPPLEVTAGHQVIADRNALRASPGDWPINRTGLSFLLSTTATVSRTANEGVQLLAEGPNSTQCILRPRKDAAFEQDQMVFRGGAFLADDVTASAWLEACQRTHELSLEATFQTSDLSQAGPARWISFSTNPDEGNIALEQRADQCVLRLLTSNGEDAGTFHEFPLFEIPDDQRHHFVVTYAPGELRCYLDGLPVELSTNVDGSLAAWKPQHLLFGDEWTGGREWRGGLQGVALYHRAITAEEAARNALHFRLQFPPDSNDAEERGE